jgi:two-component system chemotaxis sensor kinase CheA
MDTTLFMDDFIAEAREHIEKIEKAFLNTASLANDPAAMNGVFRTAHSLKGTAGFFSLKKIVAVAHELESVFTQIKDGLTPINDDLTESVLKSVDCLHALVSHIHNDEKIDANDVISMLKRYAPGDEAHEAQPAGKAGAAETTLPILATPRAREHLADAYKHGHKAYFISLGFNRSLQKYYQHPDKLLENILSVSAVIEAAVNGEAVPIKPSDGAAEITEHTAAALARYDTSTLELLLTSVLEHELLSIAIEIDPKFIRLIPRENARPKAAANKPSGEPVAAASVSVPEAGHYIRLNVAIINSLMDLANELILTRNQLLSTVSGSSAAVAGLSPILHDMNRLVSEMQEKVMLTRMQPIGLVFNKFPRMIRDLAKELNKNIEIETAGSGVLLDKYMLEALTDPITQIVKNSADHGIETYERRAELGKPADGKISLNAYMRDGSAIIEVTDDGAGLDVEALKTVSIKRGIATEETLSAMQREDLFMLIMEPGFSTAKKVTDLSGRGVGMDIVKTNIENLGGAVEIASEQDTGTTVRLKMPPTLSVVRTLIVYINDILYAVPEVNVERIVRIVQGVPGKKLERVNSSLVLSIDGRIIPVITMDEITAKVLNTHTSALSSKQRFGTVTKCLVLKTDGRSFALLIDDAIETVETLVKPLPAYLRNCPCYASVTVLGNGKAVTILDAGGIARLMGIEKDVRPAAADCETTGVEEKQVILFKCSGAEIYALETKDIARIEAINPGQIQEIGDGRYINTAGKTVQILRPEDYAALQRFEYKESKLYMLTLKYSDPPVALLAAKVMDKVEGTFSLDGDRLYSDFVFGTSVYNDKILIFLNPAAIVQEAEADRQRKKKEASHFCGL